MIATMSLGKLRRLYDNIPFSKIPQIALELEAAYGNDIFPEYKGKQFCETSFDKILETLDHEGKVFYNAPNITHQIRTMIKYQQAWGWAIFSHYADKLLYAGYFESLGDEYDGYPF